MTAEQAIKAAEELAVQYPCVITLENISPVYVPVTYETTIDGDEQAYRGFPNGSEIVLELLLF
jgi:hypothetical protein